MGCRAFRALKGVLGIWGFLKGWEGEKRKSSLKSTHRRPLQDRSIDFLALNPQPRTPKTLKPKLIYFAIGRLVIHKTFIKYTGSTIVGLFNFRALKRINLKPERIPLAQP